MYFQRDPSQSQMLLMNSERLALLLAQNLKVQSVQIVSDNIGKCLSYPNNSE